MMNNDVMAMTTTSGSVIVGNGTTYPAGDWPWWTPNWIQPSTYYYHVVEPPRECSGDVHVFQCPHCEKCKCGAATVKRAKAKK